MDIEGVLAITFIFGGGSVFLLAISPIGRAIADRIRGKGAISDQRVRMLQENQDALLDEMDSVRTELADLQERLDFTERLLTRGRESNGRAASRSTPV